jgi:hypothetical protein
LSLCFSGHFKQVPAEIALSGRKAVSRLFQTSDNRAYRSQLNETCLRRAAQLGLGTVKHLYGVMLVPDLEKLEQQLEDIGREVRNLTVMGMDPNQSPDQLELIRNLEISARAEMRLRTMAIEHAKSELRD